MPFNDWACPECKHCNFEKRDKCRQCGCFKSKSTRSTIRTQSLSSPSSSSAPHNSPATPQFKQGDWFCDACGAMSFAARNECYKCKTPKPKPDTGLAETTDNADSDDTGRGKCIICWMKDPEVVFTKCAHYVCCYECLPALEACPMCRVKFSADRSDMLKVYTP